VFVALGIQHAMHIRHIAICCLPIMQYFSTLSHKWHDFRKKKVLLDIKSVFWFSLQLLSETFLILRRNERDAFINVHISVAMLSSCYSCQVLIKLEFSRQIFEKYSNINFHENLSSRRRVVPCGRTDRHDGDNNRFFYCPHQSQLRLPLEHFRL